MKLYNYQLSIQFNWINIKCNLILITNMNQIINWVLNQVKQNQTELEIYFGFDSI